MESIQFLKKSEIIGIPDDKAIATLSPYLSKGLIQLLKGANQVEKDDAATQTEPSPGLSEGWNLFFSVYEGPTSWKELSFQAKGNQAFAIIEFTLTDPNSSKPEIWQRKITMVHESQRWLIDDLIDIPQDNTNHPAGLRYQLKDFIQTKGGTLKK